MGLLQTLGITKKDVTAQLAPAVMSQGYGAGVYSYGGLYATGNGARPDEAQIVQSAVLVKARILDGQHCVFHDLRNFSDGREVATFFAKLTH